MHVGANQNILSTTRFVYWSVNAQRRNNFAKHVREEAQWSLDFEVLLTQCTRERRSDFALAWDIRMEKVHATFLGAFGTEYFRSVPAAFSSRLCVRPKFNIQGIAFWQKFP